MDKKPFNPGKIPAIYDGLKAVGLKPIEHFGFGLRPETGEHIIWFNLPNNGSFHAVLETFPIHPCEVPDSETSAS
jgi:hypothetical protein